MGRLQESRSEETRRAILSAAGRLFAQKGFDAVSIREIAKEAGCSHTTLYIYFKDKEALLHELSVGPLEGLHQQLREVLDDKSLAPREKAKRLGSRFVQFCLEHRTMYSLFFTTKAERVDCPEPAVPLNRLRNQLFGMLRESLLACLPPDLKEETGLAYARIYFYTLHGIVGTYNQSEEPLEQLLERLTPTFELTVEVLLDGFIQNEKRRSEKQ